MQQGTGYAASLYSSTPIGSSHSSWEVKIVDLNVASSKKSTLYSIKALCMHELSNSA